ncbi:DUF6233 domain-containing protein [Streptomyces sp. NPDC001530]|uniref:DUF6233 domain-containing protein n=1 Tax=Streptomyces sp. NPDC001530 TaxID=3364582 RepID=UPI0036D0612C
MAIYRRESQQATVSFSRHYVWDSATIRPRGAADWLIEQGLSGREPVYVHVGGCWNAGKRSRGVERDQAVRALAEGGVPACPHCRPDTGLGILDQ